MSRAHICLGAMETWRWARLERTYAMGVSSSIEHFLQTWTKVGRMLMPATFLMRWEQASPLLENQRQMRAERQLWNDCPFYFCFSGVEFNHSLLINCISHTYIHTLSFTVMYSYTLHTSYKRGLESSHYEVMINITDDKYAICLDFLTIQCTHE